MSFKQQPEVEEASPAEEAPSLASTEPGEIAAGDLAVVVAPSPGTPLGVDANRLLANIDATMEQLSLMRAALMEFGARTPPVHIPSPSQTPVDLAMTQALLLEAAGEAAPPGPAASAAAGPNPAAAPGPPQLVSIGIQSDSALYFGPRQTPAGARPLPPGRVWTLYF